MNIIMSHAIQHQAPMGFILPPRPAQTRMFKNQFPLNELQLSTDTLGSGSFGTVYKGRWRGQYVAVKQFKTREERDSFAVEVEQLSSVKHENIVSLYGATTLPDTSYLIMEYAEGGSLNHLLHECREQEYDLRHACSWARQTARGVAYLHGIRPKPIMHRDLKPANLLLFSRGKILKICDFGTACTVKTQMTNNTGSASYMAPEVFATDNYLESGDVYSWSIIFWEILARRHPYAQKYSNPYQILWLVKQEGIRPSKLESCPKIIWRLITRSWDKDPEKRPTMQKVADEMAYIFSLTEKSTTSNRIRNSNNTIQQPISPNHQFLPICSHFNERDQHRQVHHHPIAEMETNHEQPLNKLSSSTNDSRKKCNIRMKALKYKLDILQSRHKELEGTDDTRNTAWDLVEEFDEIKKETQTKKEVLEFRRRLSSTVTNTGPKFDHQSPS